MEAKLFREFSQFGLIPDDDPTVVGVRDARESTPPLSHLVGMDAHRIRVNRLVVFVVHASDAGGHNSFCVPKTNWAPGVLVELAHGPIIIERMAALLVGAFLLIKGHDLSSGHCHLIGGRT